MFKDNKSLFTKDTTRQETCRDVFNNDLDRYSKTMKRIYALAPDMRVRPKENQPWSEIESILDRLEKNNKNTMTNTAIEVRKDKFADVLEEELRVIEHDAQELVIPTEIEEAKQTDVINFHKTKIAQINAKVDEQIKTLDTHIKICQERMKELQSLKAGYDQFGKTTATTKRKPRKRKASAKTKTKTRTTTRKLPKAATLGDVFK